MAIQTNMSIVSFLKELKTRIELLSSNKITEANMSTLKTGKAKAIRFSTLEKICSTLKCQPGDILEYKEDDVKSLL